MKCLRCLYEWSQPLEKNRKGQYKFGGVRCPKCGSRDFSMKVDKFQYGVEAK
jgi:DNA-directed RNA polymerase subunit RPC12/RpoP